MTDRELLELAAKAAGEPDMRNWTWQDIDTYGWNPLESDGDALRLLVNLPFRELYVSEIGATVSWRRDDASGHGLKCDEYAEEHGGDLSAATRRAIVRAAAEIGKTL